MIDARDLCVGGMGGLLHLEVTDGMIGAVGRKSPTVDDQNAVLAWLQQRSEIAKVEVWDRVDAWHGWDSVKKQKLRIRIKRSDGKMRKSNRE
jgi:hypothetical protein